MKDRIKELWLEALRSGEYEQGTNKLVIENGETQFCCLGVLTNLYVEETGDAEVWEISTAVLSDKVRNWAGIRDNNPSLQLDDGNESAAVMNDSGYDFDKIADAIGETEEL